MKSKSVFYIHTLCLAALFFLSPTILFLPPENSDKYIVLGMISAVLLSIITCIIVNIFATKIRFSKKASIPILIFLSVFSLFLASKTFLGLSEFISRVLLPDFSLFVVNIILLVTIIFISLKREENILKLALIAFFISLCLIIVFLLFSLGNFKLDNLKFDTFPNVQDIFIETKPYITSLVLPVILLPFYKVFALKEQSSSAVIWGVIIGGILLIICLLSTILIFGNELSRKLDFPYLLSISTISIGKLFSRMDGFSYFIFYICSLLKISTCTFISYNSLKKLSALL